MNVALASMFENKQIVDDRVPFLLYENQQLAVGLLLPDILGYYVQVVLLLLAQLVFSLLLCTVTYYGIVKADSPTSANLLGFGLLLPFVLVSPFPLIEALDLPNKCIRMLILTTPLTFSLTCLEAMAGFVPKEAKTSLGAYLTRNGLLLRPELDSKTSQLIKAGLGAFLRQLLTYLIHMVFMSLIFSFLSPSDYQPFEPYKRPATDIFVAWHWRDLANTLVGAWLMSQSLAFSLGGVSMAIILLGRFQPAPVVDNPMLKSSSPSDFWGRRWNQLIHTGLKQGVYKPVRSVTSSAALAGFSAFLVSGLLHEYVWSVIFYTSRHETDGDAASSTGLLQPPVFGKSLLFFGWNGLLIVFEYWIGRERWKIWTKSIPDPVVAAMVVLLALPVGHLFTGDIITGHYMHHMQKAAAMIVVERKAVV